jgi:hypothetical protein
MNCRASKQLQGQAKQDHQTLQIKRTKQSQPASFTSTNSRSANKQNSKSSKENEKVEEEQDEDDLNAELDEETKERSGKRPKTLNTSSNQYCKSCKSCISKENLTVPERNDLCNTPTNCNQPPAAPMTTPMRPIFFEKEREASSYSKWTCSTCLVQNDSSKTNCACCSTANPSKTTKATTTASNLTENTNKTTNLFAVKSDSQSKWSCGTCLVQNDSTKSTCACCSTPRPSTSTNLVKSTLDTTDSTTKQKWTCKTCLVANECDKTSCVCCSTARDASEQAKPVANKLTSGLFGLSSAKVAKWSCTVCLVSNDEEKTSCVCCSTARSGSACSEEPKTKFSSLVAAAGSLTNSGTATTSLATKSISFGLSAQQAPAMGIKFSASNFSIGNVGSEVAASSQRNATSGLFGKQISFGFGETNAAENKINNDASKIER